MGPHTRNTQPRFAPCSSAQALDELRPGEAYVIGGLVDHNRCKGLTHRRATEAGVRCVRLPIDEHLDMTQRRVLAGVRLTSHLASRRSSPHSAQLTSHRDSLLLAVNHVFEMLVYRAAGEPWADAIVKAMPMRRGAVPRGAEGEEAEPAEGE